MSRALLATFALLISSLSCSAAPLPLGPNSVFPLGPSANSVALLPLNANIAYIGDSIIGNGDVYNSPHNSEEVTIGPATWGNVLANNIFRLPNGANVGIGGQTTTQIAARFTSALAPYNPQIVLINGGRNDTTSTPSVTEANYTSIVAQLATIGARGVILPILPWTGESGQDETFRLAVNAFLLTLASPTVAVVNITGFNASTMTQDGTHPNTAGARFLGAPIATAYQQLAGTGGNILFTSAGDPADLMAGVGFFTGSGGTLGGTATGVVANSWKLDNTNTGGAGVAGAVLTNPGGGEWQQVTLSGNFTAGNVRTELLSPLINLSGLTSANVIESFCAIQADANLTNITSIWGQYTWFDGSFNILATNAAFVNNIGDILASGPAFSGVFRSSAMSLSGFGTPAFLAVNLQISLNPTGGSLPVTGSVRFGQCGARKVS